MRFDLAKKKLSGVHPKGFDLNHCNQLTWYLQRLIEDPTIDELKDMLVFPYCGMSSGGFNAVRDLKLPSIRYLQDKLGDDTFYVLKGIAKPQNDESAGGKELYKVNQGTPAVP